VPTTSRLQFDRLLTPIDGVSPAGDSRAYAHRLREQLQELRREDDPTAYDEATRPDTWKHADWEGVLELAEAALHHESKDLRVACHLAEALVHLDGLGGLQQSLQLIRRLSEEGWDRLNPPLEDDDLDARAAPLANMLDDPDRGLCFPNLIRELPLIGAGDRSLSFVQWKRLRASGEGDALSHCNQILQESDPQQLDIAFGQAANCLDELKALRAVLDQKLGHHAPGFIHLEEAISDCHRLVGLALQEVGGSSTAPGEVTAEEIPPATETTNQGLAKVNARQMLEGRKAAYQQIEQAANFLCQVEPHSPVPYLVKRAVELSKLPFPQMIRCLVREESILSEMYRELGIDASASSSSDVS
jgi:type VI secretion system protein ImpA